jgi:putative endonuclease
MRKAHERELRARRTAANKALSTRPIENDDIYDDVDALVAAHEEIIAGDATFGPASEQLRLLPDEEPGYVDPSTVERGGVGESIASRFLIDQGYRIVERNFRMKLGELDIVAFDRDVLCFVEVRMRATGEFGHAADTVDGRKRAKVSRAALLYLMVRKPSFECARFDVVAITGDQIDLIRDAWRLGDRM